MKGLQMMLKSLGISIDPAEVEALWRKLSVAIPQFLTEADKKITSIDARLDAIEKHLAIKSENRISSNGVIFPRPDEESKALTAEEAYEKSGGPY